MAERGTVTKRSRLGKNKKKAWRKVDINDVEEALEDERLQERTGGLLEKKEDASLFYVDKSVSLLDVDKPKQSNKRKAQEKLKEIEVALQPPPPKRKDKRARAVIDRERSGQPTLTQKDSIEKRRAAKQQSYARTRNRVKMPIADVDIWAEQLTDSKPDDDHFLTVTKKKRVKAPARLTKSVSDVPAVETPHPGASYNPAFDEYQALLKKANSREMGRQRDEERIKRALDEKFPDASEAPTEVTTLQEMSAGLFEGVDSDEETPDPDISNLSVNPPIRREHKKDERRRKKEKARKQKLKEKENLKEKRKKDNNIFRLKSIKAEIRKETEEAGKKAEERAEKRTRDGMRTRRLAKTKFEEPDMEVKLSDELVGSLRELRPEGHLLIDRFQSLMKRNKLEPRGAPGRKQKRKYKPKVFEKKSHKDVK
ncbi:NOP53-like protein [Mya arenaria]|uniref:Ribosome biogenesis protein NOP53 n=2 Tax=Mya arenaria TaxID=6604 RepID=A0ABY7FBE5_MYAAR|nr:ribosome biogenesis protein NOP53-like isoform X2 [Mya arenaria]WAR18932.1 NOP53-like protein [Mya arenaria]